MGVPESQIDCSLESQVCISIYSKNGCKGFAVAQTPLRYHEGHGVRAPRAKYEHERFFGLYLHRYEREVLVRARLSGINSFDKQQSQAAMVSD